MDQQAQSLCLTNTVSGKKEVFIPENPPAVRMYVCGITPYDYAHLGHGRCYVTFDLLYRLLRFLNYDVTYCRNYTDIDDKLLARAQTEYGDEHRYKEVADHYIQAFEQDMKALACMRPTHEPRVTNHIPAIIAFIQELVDTGHAYAVDSDVYFSIESFPSYGKLSKRNQEELLAGARVAVNEKKKSPLDFALWKGEPEGLFWKSPWGWGRPGWHIECSALARLYLGSTLDIHGGGMDLIFPHHENEIAQSEALSPLPFARFWVHNAFVRINQEKMSKSLKNFFTLRDLFRDYDPMVLRYLFLQHQYRNPLDFALSELPMIQKSYQRLCKLADDEPLSADVRVNQVAWAPCIQRMIQFLLDDLNVPGMLGVLFESFKEIESSRELKSQANMVLKQLLGLSLVALPEKEVLITPEIERLLKEREEARKRKDWAQADALRDELRMLGIEPQDKKS